jgi:hypothetical protein
MRQLYASTALQRVSLHLLHNMLSLLARYQTTRKLRFFVIATLNTAHLHAATYLLLLLLLLLLLAAAPGGEAALDD